MDPAEPYHSTTDIMEIGVSGLESALDEIDFYDPDSVRNFLSFVPSNHPLYRRFTIAISQLLQERYENLGALDDLEDAIRYCRRAIELTSRYDENYASLFSSLGGLLDDRFENCGKDLDLEEAIASYRQSLELTPIGHIDLPSRLSHLATSLYTRFNHNGEDGDLTEAIASYRKAIELAPSGHCDLSAWLNNLGCSLDLRFCRYGEDGDLTEGIASCRKAIFLTPVGHRDLPSRLNHLGISLRKRFKRYGEDGDLTEAISSHRQAIKLTPAGHSNLSGWLSNLGNALYYRFSRYEEDGDLMEAIASHRRAVELTPSGHIELPSRLNNLAVSLSMQFNSCEDGGDLDEAITSYRRTIQLAPASHSGLPSYFSNLGHSLYSRFCRYGEDEDLTLAVACSRKAIELTPADHPDLPTWLHDLARSLEVRFHRYGVNKDLEESFFAYKYGSEVDGGFRTLKFQCALDLASVAHKQGYLVVALEAYYKIFDLLSQVAWFGQSVSSRQRKISSWQPGLASDAAACAITLGHLELAVEFLDHGRSVFWSQATQTSADLTELKKVDPSLALKFEHLASSLGTSTFEDPAVTVHEPTHEDNEIEQRRCLAREFESLLESIRALPDFNNFMRPPPYAELRAAAASGPVILLNASEYRSDALIITRDSPPILVPLTEMPLDEATRLATDLRENRGSRDFRLRLQTTLPVLWRSIVLPVLEALEFTGATSDPRRRPHVWWCPTGPLSFLPIHAAGPYTKSGGPDITHRVISSYTVTLQALLRARKQSPNSRNFQMLLVGQADTPHQKPLPGVSEEIKAIHKIASARGVQNISRIEGPEVLRDAVVEQLKGASCAHFACHGHQDQTGGALQSALFVHDGPLRLSTIASCRLPNADFAFLSACDSASGLDKLPDEAMHIAAGMQVAGFRSVIATMWAIGDGTGPIVAEKVYSHLLRNGPDGFDSTEAAFALNEGVQCLRKGKKYYPTDEWVPFIHIGI